MEDHLQPEVLTYDTDPQPNLQETIQSILRMHVFADERRSLEISGGSVQMEKSEVLYPSAYDYIKAKHGNCI